MSAKPQHCKTAIRKRPDRLKGLLNLWKTALRGKNAKKWPENQSNFDQSPGAGGIEGLARQARCMLQAPVRQAGSAKHFVFVDLRTSRTIHTGVWEATPLRSLLF
ncbi:hypothetical protein K3217_31190 [bacterium BD-1]|nr:hypothetical protein [Ottowia caeni]